MTALIQIRFPAVWNKRGNQQAAIRSMAEYRAHEFLVWDLTARLLESGHSEIFLRKAAAVLVGSVISVEAKLVRS